MGPKKREPLATTFTCLFCNHEKSVTVKMDKKTAQGFLSCKVCGQQFQSNINYLSAAVDVYSDWIDACEAVALNHREDVGGSAATDEDRKFSSYGTRNEGGAGGGGGSGRAAGVEDDEDEDEDAGYDDDD